MFQLLVILALTSLLSARPQTDTESEGYDVYGGEYYDNYDYDYEDSYDSQVTIFIVISPCLHHNVVFLQDQLIGSSQAEDSSRFPRQTFSTGSVNSIRGGRGGTTSRPARQSQRQQSARQTAANPPLGPYNYGYAVTDDNGLDFNQQETSNGGVVTGQYSVVLPDGRIQTVKYSVAPDTGYVVSTSTSTSTSTDISELL